MTTALEGLRVLDFSWGLPGAIATMVLADNGADVIKVEPPGGDPQRSMPAFAQWHRGKRSVVADLKHEGGRVRARALAAQADVLVQSWRTCMPEASSIAPRTFDGDVSEGEGPGRYCRGGARAVPQTLRSKPVGTLA